MKRTPLINRHLSHLVASLGHLDEITIADAGLPVPDGVTVIDLAVSPGVPAFFDVLAALRHELVIEAIAHAEEADGDLRGAFEGARRQWADEQKSPISMTAIPHAAFKARTMQSKAVIRTGETTPYCNLILVSGVAF